MAECEDKQALLTTKPSPASPSFIPAVPCVRALSFVGYLTLTFPCGFFLIVCLFYCFVLGFFVFVLFFVFLGGLFCFVCVL